VPVDLLNELLSHSEHIRELIEESAAAVTSANAGIQQTLLDRACLPEVNRVLDNQAAATRQLHEAAARLTALEEVLHGEIRERTLIDHQLAAAVEQEEGARNAALHDQLTGLPNRVLFNDRLEHGVAQATRHGWMLAVMFVDLDAFKSINDTHGHPAGDAVLKSIAQRLAHTTRHEDTISRYGGDEFLCLLTPLHAPQHIAMIAAKVLAAIKAPCEVSGRAGLIELCVSASIGISVFPQHGASPAELIRRADEAMYVAKQNKLGFAFA
jgi:diguanylate cyclase (GGDEF)-like protein